MPDPKTVLGGQQGLGLQQQLGLQQSDLQQSGLQHFCWQPQKHLFDEQNNGFPPLAINGRKKCTAIALYARGGEMALGGWWGGGVAPRNILYFCAAKAHKSQPEADSSFKGAWGKNVAPRCHHHRLWAELPPREEAKEGLRWEAGLCGFCQQCIVCGLQRITNASKLRCLQMLDTTLDLHECLPGHINSDKLQPPDKLRLAHLPLFADGAYIHSDMDKAILLNFLLNHGPHLFQN